MQWNQEGLQVCRLFFISRFRRDNKKIRENKKRGKTITSLGGVLDPLSTLCTSRL